MDARLGMKGHKNSYQGRNLHPGAGAFLLRRSGRMAMALGLVLIVMEQQRRVDEQKAQNASGDAVDYDLVRKLIKDLVDDSIPNDENGDSYGPLLVRLAWHASGTYDKKSGTGGSNGATMRFPPESSDGANAGLHVARSALDSIKKKFPGLSHADLWTLAGVVAVQQMGGPEIPWRPGRSDYVASESSKVPANGRLPDAAQGADHIRAVFGRMGFNDREMVALIGAHTLGRCHTDRSGYEGPWTRAPTTFSNDFYKVLLEKKWTNRQWRGPKQFENADGKDLMMLPADMALMEDNEFRKYVELYAKDRGVFFKDFAGAFSKLLELGVPFKKKGLFW